MTKVEWTFPSVSKCEEKGLNDSGVETFRGDTIVSLAREICQNSLDAAVDPVPGADPVPVEVEFALFDLPTADFPGLDEFRDAMDRSRAYWQSNDKTRQFFDTLSSVLAAPRLTCLRISDFHTKGLVGVHDPDGAEGSAWRSLVLSSGVSNKAGGITGGSFGIGKFASFSCSSFRTVFYATKTIDGCAGSQGVCRLVTFRTEDGEMTLGTGYAGAADMAPLPEWRSLDTAFERTIPGTDLFIPAFVGGKDFRSDIVKSVLDGFLDAIWEKRLVVKIDDGENRLLIDKSWLLKAYRENDALMEGVRPLFEALRQPAAKWKAKSFGDLGGVRLSLVNGKDLDKRIAMIRQPGMLIFKKDRFRSHVSFTGVLLVEGELNRLLRDFENPQHNRWEEKRAPEQVSILNDIYKFCHASVAEIVKEDLGEEIDSGLGDVLPDSGNEGDPRTEETLDVKIRGDVTVAETPRRKRRTHRKSVTGGKPTGADSGSDRHDGERPRPAKSDDGMGGAAKVIRRDVPFASFRSVCRDRAAGLYRLKIVPAKDAATASVALVAVAEVKDYAASVRSARLPDGTPLAVTGNEVSGFAFRKGEPTEIIVELDYHDYVSLEAEGYEHK